jgi:agmatine deiminase
MGFRSASVLGLAESCGDGRLARPGGAKLRSDFGWSTRFSAATPGVEPAIDSIRMPAEWEAHDATWLAWPHYRDDWPGKFEPIPWVYAEIIRHLARHEHVELIVNDAASEKRARKVLDRANVLSDNIRFHRWPTNRVWTRDSGCTFVTTSSFARPDSRGRLSPRGSKPGGHDFSPADREINRSQALAPEGDLLAVKWRFNAWAKYSNY